MEAAFLVLVKSQTVQFVIWLMDRFKGAVFVEVVIWLQAVDSVTSVATWSTTVTLATLLQITNVTLALITESPIIISVGFATMPFSVVQIVHRQTLILLFVCLVSRITNFLTEHVLLFLPLVAPYSRIAKPVPTTLKAFLLHA